MNPLSPDERPEKQSPREKLGIGWRSVGFFVALLLLNYVLASTFYVAH